MWLWRGGKVAQIHGFGAVSGWPVKCWRRVGPDSRVPREIAMQTLLQDLRFALRQIRRNAGFSFTAVLTLTLGIGATVAVYSILYDAVLHPWPYAGFDRVCQVWMTEKSGREGIWGLTGPQVNQVAKTHAVEDVLVVDQQDLIVTGGDVPDDVKAI